MTPAINYGARYKAHRKKGKREKGHGKRAPDKRTQLHIKGHWKMSTGEKGTNEKLGKRAHEKKIVIICKLLSLLFN